MEGVASSFKWDFFYNVSLITLVFILNYTVWNSFFARCDFELCDIGMKIGIQLTNIC